MKKLLVAILSCMVLFAVTAPASVDAKPRSGSYNSPKKSFDSTTPSKSQTDNVSRSDQGTASKTPGTAATTPAQKPGLFGGAGGFMKGMLIGGLAGMLFGGLFGNMGALGNILGFLVNILAVVALFIAIKGIVSYFIRRRKEARANRT